MSKCCATLVTSVVFALLFLSTANAVSAQTGPALTERERQQRRMDQVYRRPDVDSKQQIALGPAREAAIRRATAAQISEDSARLQFESSEMQRLVSHAATLNYEAIAKAAGEINKRAVRLNRNLGLPLITDAQSTTGENQFADAQLLAAMKQLDETIRRLSRNPLLVNRRILDAAQTATGGRDLATIIALSEQIKSNAKRLRRTANKR